ncbi:M20/M25/M40 family metallo-hydrolase, partial [Lactiplantibacillus plantarum]
MDKNSKSIISIRRQLHSIPELAFHETMTRQYIKRFVAQYAKDFVLVDDSQGGLIYFKSGEGGSVLWRTEIDALPLNDLNKVSYVSKNFGVCHACGHDAHMAILLDTMRNIQNRRTNSVYCVFQSAEEVFGGAQKMKERLTALKIHVNAAFALHVDPSQMVGSISSKTDLMLAQNDTYYFDLGVSGGHLSNGNTQLSILSTVINFIDKYQSNKLRIGISQVTDNGYFNISPSHLHFSLSFRSLKLRNDKLLEKLIDSIKCTNLVTRLSVRKLPHYPAVINDYQLVKSLKMTCESNNIDFTTTYSSFSSDDFSYYQSISDSSLYFLLGCNLPEKGKLCHSESFDINEKCLEIGAKICNTILKKKGDYGIMKKNDKSIEPTVEMKSLLDDLEVETIELDNVQAVPTAAASGGSGKSSLCGSSSSSTCSSS